MSVGYNFMWAMSLVYQRGAVVSLHSHPFYHYFYVKDGDGTIRIGDDLLELRRGSLYMMPCDTPHEICSGGGLVAYEIKFDGADDSSILKTDTLCGELNMIDSGIEEVFECIFNEMMNAEPYYKERINVRFFELLLLIARRREQRLTGHSIGYSEKYAAVLFYMQNHISEPISLRVLADICHMERIYFLKRFKSEMGMTPMNYLRNIRINQAKKLLEHSDMNVTQISSAVGFQTIHHFTSTFKKLVGVSPSEYKASK